MERFTRFALATAVVGGLLLAAGAGLQATTGSPMSVAATTTVFTVAAGLRLAGAVALVIGMTGIYLLASEAGGRFGLVAYTLVVANLVMQAGIMWADAFLSGAVARSAPGILDGTVSDARLSAGFAAAWLLNVSFALLGVVVLRSHVYSRVVGWSLVLMGLVTLVPLPVDGMVYEVLIGVAAVVAGVAAHPPAPDPMPGRTGADREPVVHES